MKDHFGDLGFMFLCLSRYDHQYAYKLLGCEVGEKPEKVHDQGKMLARGSKKRAEEIVNSLKAHLAEIIESES